MLVKYKFQYLANYIMDAITASSKRSKPVAILSAHVVEYDFSIVNYNI